MEQDSVSEDKSKRKNDFFTDSTKKSIPIDDELHLPPCIPLAVISNEIRNLCDDMTEYKEQLKTHMSETETFLSKLEESMSKLHLTMEKHTSFAYGAKWIIIGVFGLLAFIVSHFGNHIIFI